MPFSEPIPIFLEYASSRMIRVEDANYSTLVTKRAAIMERCVPTMQVLQNMHTLKVERCFIWWTNLRTSAREAASRVTLRARLWGGEWGARMYRGLQQRADGKKKKRQHCCWWQKTRYSQVRESALVLWAEARVWLPEVFPLPCTSALWGQCLVFHTLRFSPREWLHSFFSVLANLSLYSFIFKALLKLVHRWWPFLLCDRLIPLHMCVHPSSVGFVPTQSSQHTGWVLRAAGRVSEGQTLRPPQGRRQSQTPVPSTGDHELFSVGESVSAQQVSSCASFFYFRAGCWLLDGRCSVFPCWVPSGPRAHPCRWLQPRMPALPLLTQVRSLGLADTNSSIYTVDNQKGPAV